MVSVSNEISQRVLFLIDSERRVQDLKWGSQRELDDKTWLAVLVEEVGEVARAILERDPDNLHEELVQIAAVAVAWLEAKE